MGGPLQKEVGSDAINTTPAAEGTPRSPTPEGTDWQAHHADMPVLIAAATLPAAKSANHTNAHNQRKTQNQLRQRIGPR